MRQTTLIALGGLLLLAGCKGPNAYVHPKADLSSVKTVAIIPFENMTQERVAADKVQRIFATELLHTAPFVVVDAGQVGRALRTERVENPASMTPAEMKKLGAALGAEGLFFGNVLTYSETKGQTTATADVSLQLRLVEAASGTVLWSASWSRGGASFSQKMFGVGGETAEEAAQQLIRDQLNTLLR
jgi:hypothetical protein